MLNRARDERERINSHYRSTVACVKRVSPFYVQTMHKTCGTCTDVCLVRPGILK